jgi:hypothetical protein
MKLTQAQKAFLNDVVRKGRETCLESYAPSRKLVELGLISARSSVFGQHNVEPTDAGRALVADESGKP